LGERGRWAAIAMMNVANNPLLEPVASEARACLQHVIAALGI
jgi:hypothetical protein